ncbi:MAG: DNA-processing protein DprA [Clostridiales bacterium]|nr:DNA-processing protein DprA [Clostridiales bacterium]
MYYWLWLQRALGVGSRKVRAVHSAYSSLEEFYQGGNTLWKETGFFTPKELRRLGEVTPQSVTPVIKDCIRLHYHILTPDHPKYPKRLLTLPDYPAALYVWGDLCEVDDEVLIAVVGTRGCTPYGQQVAMQISATMAKAGVVIVSGGAYGVDTIAHKGALKTGGRTIAVLAGGINAGQLVGNEELRRQIVEQQGAVLSEYPPGAPIGRNAFPIRNRLMSGLSLGTLVVEAGERSGALITANWANEQGRDVFAIPGSVMSPTSLGCNRLIAQGAKPVACAYDILEEYIDQYPHRISLKIAGIKESASPVTPPAPGKTQKRQAAAKSDSPHEKKPQTPQVNEAVPTLSDGAKALYAVLPCEPAHINDLAAAAKVEVRMALAAMTELEIAGLTQSFPGRRFCRKPNR